MLIFKLTISPMKRAKLENKFYAAMRDKEAVENERKNLARIVEKQAKMVESLHTSETSSRARIVSCSFLFYLMSSLTRGAAAAIIGTAEYRIGIIYGQVRQTNTAPRGRTGAYTSSG